MVAAMAVLIVGLAGPSGAATAWKKIGQADAVGTAPVGTMVALGTNTPANPSAVKFAVSSPDGRTHRTDMMFMVACWKGKKSALVADDMKSKRTPFVITYQVKDLGFTPEGCTAIVFASHYRTGKLRAKVLYK
jgi:hypothetical protein